MPIVRGKRNSSKDDGGAASKPGGVICQRPVARKELPAEGCLYTGDDVYEEYWEYYEDETGDSAASLETLQAVSTGGNPREWEIAIPVASATTTGIPLSKSAIAAAPSTGGNPCEGEIAIPVAATTVYVNDGSRHSEATDLGPVDLE